MTAYVALSGTSPSAGNPSASGPGRRTRKAVAKAAAVITGGFAALTVLASLASGSASAATAPRNWIGTGWHVHLAYRADQPTIKHFFSAATSFGTGPSAAAGPVTEGLPASATLYYSSYAQFQADVDSGAIT